MALGNSTQDPNFLALFSNTTDSTQDPNFLALFSDETISQPKTTTDSTRDPNFLALFGDETISQPKTTTDSTQDPNFLALFGDDSTNSKPVRLAKSFGQGAISAIKNTYDFLKMKNPTLFGTEKTGIDFIDNREKEDKIAKVLDLALEKTTVQDPTFDEKVSSGFGSMASFLIPGLGFARTARAAQAAPKVAALLGTSAMGVVEASAEAGGTYNEAKAMGKTEDEAQRDANETFFANIPANILLNQGLLSKIPEGEKIRKALTQAGKEATQEFVQQVISNVAVDDEFGIESFEGAGESALIGGIVGGGVSGVGSALSKDSPTTTIEQQEQPIEESEKIEIDKMANAKELVKNVKSLGKKYLTSSGAMPKDIYQVKTKADSRLNAELQELKFTNFDFQKAQSKIEFNENDIESMNMALEGKASLVGKLEPLQDSLKKMRTHIDKLSQQMIDEGVVEGDLVGVVDKNKGFYVTRAYQVHDDPNWSKKVPEDVRNRAKAFIRKNMTKDVYNFYNENQSLGVGRAKDFQLTKDANKIQKFKDDLSGKVDSLRTRIDSKLNLEQDKLQTQFKEKTFLEANKKRTPKYTERGIKVNTNRLNKLQQILKDSRPEFKALGKTLGIEDVATEKIEETQTVTQKKTDPNIITFNDPFNNNEPIQIKKDYVENMYQRIFESGAGRRSANLEGVMTTEYSSFPDWNKGRAKSQTLPILQKIINGEKLTAVQTEKFISLYEDYLQSEEIAIGEAFRDENLVERIKDVPEYALQSLAMENFDTIEFYLNDGVAEKDKYSQKEITDAIRKIQKARNIKQSFKLGPPSFERKQSRRKNVEKEQQPASRTELTPQQESIVLRRTRLLKREIKTAEKIENEIDRIKNEIQTIANQNLKRKQTELKSKIERQKSRIDKRDADIDALYDLINELDAMKKEYTQGVLNIAFMHKSQYTNRFGEIYDIRDPEMQKKLEYVGLTENNIEGFTEALITEQQQMYRGLLTKENAKALGILKKRKEIPLEIRELWGQYLDPSATYAKSIDRMATLISKHEFLSEARDIGMGTYFFEKPEGREFSVRIKGESNPLAGLYTSRDIAEAMDGLNEVQGLGSNFMKLYYSGIAATKYMKTIGSFKTQVRNFVSGFQFMVMQGNIPLKPKDLKAFQEALKISGTQILNSTNQELRDKVIELKRIGLIEGELQTSELKALYKDAGLMEKFFDPSTTEGSTAKKKLKRLKYLLEVPASFYQAGDNVWKMVQFEMEKAKYKKAMPELSESELQKIAVENVRGTMQYYSLSSFAAKKLNRNPVIGTFALFWAETLRIQANSIRLINKELKNPKLRAIGMRRLVGFMVGSQMWKIIAKAGAMGLGLAAKGFTDEDEENMKRFDASWERNTNKLYTKIDKENGIYNFIDMSAYDIYGAQNKAIYALFGGERKEALKEFFKPVADLDIFTKSMVEAISNKDLETGKEIGPSDKTIQRIIVHAGKDFLPGSLNDALRIKKSFSEEANICGRRYDTSIEVGAALGYRETSRDIGKSLGFKIRHFNSQEDKITGKKTEDEIRETRMSLYESLHKDMIAAEKLGVSQLRIRQIARLSGLQGRKFNVIYYGNYDSYINQSIRKSNIRKRKKESMIETAYPYNKE
jgi:hypothetical protein